MNARLMPMRALWLRTALSVAVLLPVCVLAAPTISVTDTALTFTEEDPATIIDGSLTVTATGALGQAEVRITGNYTFPEDVLSGGNTAVVDAVWDPVAGRLALTPAAPAASVTAAEMEAALRTVVYKNTNVYDPDNGSRTVRFLVTEAPPGFLAAQDFATIDIQTVNDAPRIVVGGDPAISLHDPTTTPYEYVDSNGTWEDDETAVGALTLTRQWRRSDDGVTYANLTGETSLRYDFDTNDDVGKWFVCRVTAEDEGALSTTADSNDDVPLPDPDGDGLSNITEDNLGTDPNDADSDDDTIEDGDEVDNNTDPTLADSDGDGLDDNEEWDPYLDTDGDGTMNARDPDSDNDGLEDGQEDRNGDGALAAAGVTPRETDPLVADTDNDGLLDGQEDRDADGNIDPGETNPRDNDSDNDTVLDGTEDPNGNGILEFAESDPNVQDTDGDGLRDDKEHDPYADTDSDGFSNAQDADSDGDGLEDAVEDANANGTVDAGESDPVLEDSDGDGMPDGWETIYSEYEGAPGLDPLDPADADSDLDGGGLSNLNEYKQNRDPTNRFDDYLPDEPGAGKEKIAYAQKVGDAPDGARSIEMTTLHFSAPQFGTHVFAGNFAPDAAFDDILLSVRSANPARADNAFIAAKNADMEWIWATRISATAGVTISDLAVYGDYVYVVGWYSGRLYCGSAEISTASWGSTNGFCLRLRAEDGVRLQHVIKRYCSMKAVAANGMDAVVCGTYYQQSFSVPKTDGSGNWTARNPQQSGDQSDDRDIFVVCLDKELATCKWGNSGGSGYRRSQDNAVDVALDDSGNAFVTGTIHGYLNYYSTYGGSHGLEGSWYYKNWTAKPATFQASDVGNIYTGGYPDIFWVDGDGGWWGGGNFTVNETSYTGVERAWVGKFRASDGRFVNSWNDSTGFPFHNYDSDFRAVAVLGAGVYTAGQAVLNNGVVVKFNTDLAHDDDLFIGNATSSRCTVLGTIPGNTSRVFVGGSFSGGDARFGDVGSVNAGNGTNIFVSEVDLGGFEWAWARTTNDQTFQTPDNLALAGIGYDSVGQRIYYGGRWGNSASNRNDLHFGDSETDLVLTNYGERSSFLSAFVTDPDGNVEYLYMVRIYIASQVGEEYILPGAGANLYLVGERVTVRAPARIYTKADDTTDVRIIWDLGQDEDNLEDYDIRYTCKGYTLDYGQYVETGTYYEFIVVDPIRLEFKWDTDFKLQVASTVTWPDPDDIGAEVLRTLGDPLPTAGVHWIPKATEVAPMIDGVTTPTDPNSYGHRYALDDYTLTTRTPPETEGATLWPQEVYSPAVFNKTTARVQVGDGIDRDYFVMLGPAVLELDWHKQVRIQLSSSSSERASLPFIRDVAASVKRNNDAQSRELWYDYGTHVHIGADKDGTTTVDVKKPWVMGDGHFEGLNYASLTVTATEVYLNIDDLSLPTSVSWNFGENLYYLTVPIGAYADLADAQDADGLLLAPADVNVEISPAVRIVKSPAGTDTENIRAWDDVGNRVWPLRPGMFYLDWVGSDGTSVIMTLITSGFPTDYVQDIDPDVAPTDTFAIPSPDPRRRHLAGTPPVVLDPSLTDAVAFVPSPFYFERGTSSAVLDPDEGDVEDGTNAAAPLSDGQVHQDGTFTCGRGGRAVLVFSYTDDPNSAASADLAQEKLTVRVVETKTWNDAADWWDGAGQLLKTAGSQEIGLRIGGGAYDEAGLGTGYVLLDNAANYNPFVYDRSAAPADFGPIIPVNRKYYPPDPTTSPPAPHPPLPQLPVSSQLGDLVVAWYRSDTVNPVDTPALSEEPILWPYRPVLYRQFDWPATDPTGGTAPTPEDSPRTRLRIVIASRLGSEGMDMAGNIQFSFDPDLYQEVSIYNQPEKGLPGCNPNEEHALIAPSYAHRDAAVRPAVAYALRDDLNHTAFDETYTSDPRVLVQYLHLADGEYRMAVYEVEREDLAVVDDRVEQSLDPTHSKSYQFTYWVKAGEPLYAPYPLDLVIGVNTCTDKAALGDPLRGTVYSEFGNQRTWFEDHRGQGWVVSGARPGNEGNVGINTKFFYPLRPEFWYDIDNDGYDWDADGSVDGDFATEQTGDCVPWLPDVPRSTEADQKIRYTERNDALLITYPTVWPEQVPILKAGETITYAGGEYRADNSAAPGLPGIIGMAAVEKVYDDRNPEMLPLDNYGDVNYGWTVRVVSPLEERRVDLDPIPDAFQPAGGLVTVQGKEYRFNGLSPSLKRRIFFDSITKELGMRGYVNERTLGASDLTAAPPAAYILEANILTPAERDELLALSEGLPGDFGVWNAAVGNLSDLTRNPTGVSMATPADPYFVGVQPYVDPVNGTVYTDRTAPFRGLGPGLAAVPNQAFLDPGFTMDEAYVTLAENNDADLGAAPITMHIVKVMRKVRYRGAVKVVVSDNAFDEKVILRHTGDFGTNTDRLVYQWFIREEDGTEQPLPGVASPEPWEYFTKSGLGKFQVSLEGTGPIILRDNLVFMRYCHEEELTSEHQQDWYGTKWDEFYDDPDQPDAPGQPGVDDSGEWAGAANSPLVDYEMRDGDVVELRTYRPQLAMGWVKRVLDGINPYEARIHDFYSNGSPSTAVSMIQQFGPRYEGQVALNPDKDVIENHGLIELYQTVLERAKALSIDLSQPANTPGVTNAILLAASRIALFYTMLGDEAYTDSRDPTIGMGSDFVDYDSMGPVLFAFQNLMPSLLDEELALLRGVADNSARPVYNRLFWNFTKEQGEAAYALCYNVTDMNNDGFINEYDAMKLYPQGHGDAWGHYLTALRMHYDLLRHPYFNWHSRSEFYNLMDVVLKVDFLDERHFAKAAAGKAKAGKDIVNLTYRAHYVDDPVGQWQGYTDTDPDRAWGVTGWARRAGQGAVFDWVTANAVLPAEAPTGKEGIERVDRSSVGDINEISAQLAGIQAEYDNANAGLNPLGLHPDAVPFDIDPTLLDAEYGPIETHFEQVYDRAVVALENARMAWAFANQQKNYLRQIANSAGKQLREALEQDLAYRNRLISIFGRPYAGTIGAGQPFAAGYAGPDILLYMYVDKTRINTDLDYSGTGTVDWEAELPSAINDFKIDGTKFSDIYDDWLSDIPELVYDPENPDGTLPYENNSDGSITLHVPLTAAGYTYQAPDEWAQRSAVGSLQSIIHDMIIAEAELQQSIKQYQIHMAGLNAMWENFAMKTGLGADSIKGKEDLNEFKFYHALSVKGFDTLIRLLGYAKKDVMGFVDITGEATPDTVVVGLSNTIPVSELVMPITKGVGFATTKVFTAIQEIGQIAKDAIDLWEMEQELSADLTGLKRDLTFDLTQQLTELLTSLGDEKVEAIEILQSAERVQQLADQYRTTLEEGIRVLEERENWNKKLAVAVQTERYADMAVRAYRNGALQKYRDSFDLAARYAYLTAKAYDYETNLSANHPASAQGVLSRIMQQKTLGVIANGVPAGRGGGIGGVLAELKANYDVLKSEMGFNNPSREIGRFSMRTELFRIVTQLPTDTPWEAQLSQRRVDNLWDLWEFRHYCRPFDTYDPGNPEPGIVIRFSSTVTSRQNFFGWPLGPGDHGFSSSDFATKIRSAGIWFSGYDLTALSGTPRVYLVPVGTDKMRMPDDPDMGVREWSIVNQKIPVPYPLSDSDLADHTWITAVDSLAGSFSDTSRYSSFRAYHDYGFPYGQTSFPYGYASGYDTYDFNLLEDYMTFSSRLVGRSVWNSQWLLIIPGSSLLADPEEGLNRFIMGKEIVTGVRDHNGVKDIVLLLTTYGHSGG